MEINLNVRFQEDFFKKAPAAYRKFNADHAKLLAGQHMLH